VPFSTIKYPYNLWISLSVIFLFLLLVYSYASAIIAPFLIGILGAYAFHVPMNTLQQYKIPRDIAAFFIVFMLVVIIYFFLMGMIPLVKTNIVLFIKNYPIVHEKIEEWLMPYVPQIKTLMKRVPQKDISYELQNYVSQGLSFLAQFISSLFKTTFALANIIALSVLTPFVMFYALKDWNAICDVFKSLLPYRYKESILHQCHLLDTTLSAYVRGQSLVCLCLMVGYMVFLSLLNIPNALFLGILTGFLAFIPYVGVSIGFLMTLTTAFEQFNDVNDFIKLIAVYICLAGVESYFLTPKLVGSRIGLHPVLIVFCLLLLGSTFGFLGVIFALPLSAVISVLGRSFIEWYRYHFVHPH